MQEKTENDPLHQPEQRVHRVAHDLQPIYELAPDQYNKIINGLFNLIVDTITRLDQASAGSVSHELAEQARSIFTDYDDDLTDILARYLGTATENDKPPSPSPF